jgi:acetolactate synthase I/II/III large subunit
MIKVTEFIAKYLANNDITQIFLISGGGAMHLNDSLGNHPKLSYFCNHHEQACAIAAEGYSRVTGKMAVVNVTTGPGGLNTLTGLMGQWTDSIPVLYLSGQVKYETTIDSCNKFVLRQLGDQEVDIINIVSPLTKYAKMLVNPNDIKKVLQEAIYHATNGRKGPVWIDIPMNVQGALVDEDDLEEFKVPVSKNNIEITLGQINEIANLIIHANRPLIIAGHGIRLSDSIDNFNKLINKLQIPVVTTFNGFDLLPDDHPLFVGRIGTIGTRSGNFSLQNSDLIICLGSRNNIRQISYNWQSFGNKAKKIIVDIDIAELNKPTIKADFPVNCDLKYFIKELSKSSHLENSKDHSEWLSWCKMRLEKYPVVLEEYKNSLKVQPYFFIRKLSELMRNDDILVAGNGSACVVEFQAGIVKKGQRIFWNSGCASMGYDIPAAIGAAIGSGRHTDVICLAGDGSTQMNLQELQTIAHYNLPIKVFYLNNDGYISIKQTQNSFFEGRKVGCDTQSGVSFPNMSKIAYAYDLRYIKIENHNNIDDKIKEVLSMTGPVICEVILEQDYIFAPKLSSEKLPDGRMISKPMEDMFPFLDREEFKTNIIT